MPLGIRNWFEVSSLSPLSPSPSPSPPPFPSPSPSPPPPPPPSLPRRECPAAAASLSEPSVQRGHPLTQATAAVQVFVSLPHLLPHLSQETGRAGTTHRQFSFSMQDSLAFTSTTRSVQIWPLHIHEQSRI